MQVEFLEQMMTSMTSSGEGHTMYLYRRVVTSRTGGAATSSRRGTVLSGSAQVPSVDPFWAQVRAMLLLQFVLS
jgi:hypothetical protein